MQIAVIGTGPAAFSVVTTLLQHPDAQRFEITLLGLEEERPSFALSGKDPRTWAPEEYDKLHRRLKSLGGGGFPPPRTQHGALLTPCLPDSRTTLYRSNYFGGIGDFWSTAMFPFRDDDFRNWPIGYADMRPYYARIAELVGISGRQEDFDELYPESFVNREPVQPTPLAHHFATTLKKDRSPRYTFMAGPNHLAVETRPGQPNACEYCGGCLYGCFKDSLFRPGSELKKMIEERKIQWVPGAVLSVTKGNDAGLTVAFANGQEAHFEKVFLCAGAIGSTEIIARSLGLTDHEITVSDNEMYNFPILYHGLKQRRFRDHFPISATVVAMKPTGLDASRSAHLLIAPLPTLTFEYYVKKRLVDALRPFIRFLQGRFLIAQMYVDGDTAARYGLHIDRQGNSSIRKLASGESNVRARQQTRDLRSNLAGTDFALPPFPLMQVSSSYHYFGGFDFRSDQVSLDARCEVLPGLYACDSMVFPDSPAQPLTFTIMANAMRVATLAVG